MVKRAQTTTDADRTLYEFRQKKKCITSFYAPTEWSRSTTTIVPHSLRKRIFKPVTDLERIPVDVSQRVVGLAYSVDGVAIVIWREGGPWFLSGDSKAAICSHGLLRMDCEECAASRPDDQRTSYRQRLLLLSGDSKAATCSHGLLLRMDCEECAASRPDDRNTIYHPWFNAEDQANTLAAYDAKMKELLAAGDSMVPTDGPFDMEKMYVSESFSSRRRIADVSHLVRRYKWKKNTHGCSSSNTAFISYRVCVHNSRVGTCMRCLSYYRCTHHNKLVINCPVCIKKVCLHGILRSQCNQCSYPCLTTRIPRGKCQHCLDIEVGLPDQMRTLPILAKKGRHAVRGRVYRQWTEAGYVIVHGA